MVAAFPVAKLGFLLVKQISKPIAKRIAAKAKESPFFRNWVCMPTAQLFHWYEIQLKLRMLDVGSRATKVPKLNETKAIEQGSEILSEVILLSIAGSILIYEYNRSSDKDEAKAEALRLEKLAIKNQITELELKVERQTIQIKALSNAALELKTDIYNYSLRRRLLEKKPVLPAELSEEEMNKPIVVPVEVVPEVATELPKASKRESGEPHEIGKEKVSKNNESLSEPLVVHDAKTSTEAKEVPTKAKIYDDKTIQSNGLTETGIITEAITLYEEGFKGTSHDTEVIKSHNQIDNTFKSKGLDETLKNSQNQVQSVKPGIIAGAVQYFMDLGKL